MGSYLTLMNVYGASQLTKSGKRRALDSMALCLLQPDLLSVVPGSTPGKRSSFLPDSSRDLVGCRRARILHALGPGECWLRSHQVAIKFMLARAAVVALWNFSYDHDPMSWVQILPDAELFFAIFSIVCHLIGPSEDVKPFPIIDVKLHYSL